MATILKHLAFRLAKLFQVFLKSRAVISVPWLLRIFFSFQGHSSNTWTLLTETKVSYESEVHLILVTVSSCMVYKLLKSAKSAAMLKLDVFKTTITSCKYKNKNQIIFQGNDNEPLKGWCGDNWKEEVDMFFVLEKVRRFDWLNQKYRLNNCQNHHFLNITESKTLQEPKYSGPANTEEHVMQKCTGESMTS